MDDELRRQLADRAFLFDDPDAYLAGVEAALRAVAERDHRHLGRAAAPHPTARQPMGMSGMERVTNRP